jgi:hypothetical protein
MTAAHLIEKLLEIERKVGIEDPAKVRVMVMEAEENVLHIEKLIIETLRENEHLRQRMETFRRASLAALRETGIAESSQMVH